jgi:hypothetical protein
VRQFVSWCSGQLCVPELERGDSVLTGDQSGQLWRRSSRCNPGECVEVSASRDRVFVRDSKDRSGPVLEFTRDSWRAFLNAMRDSDGGRHSFGSAPPSRPDARSSR